MNHTPTGHHRASEPVSAPPFWRSRYAAGLLVLGAVASYFLLSEHRAHFFGALPYLLLLACPVIHIFMHGGHGGGHGGHTGGGPPRSDVPAVKTGERP